MKNLLLPLAIVLSSVQVVADAPVCHKCQEIREYNEKHPQKEYDDYNDYLKEKGLNKDLTPGATEKPAETAPAAPKEGNEKSS